MRLVRRIAAALAIFGATLSGGCDRGSGASGANVGGENAAPEVDAAIEKILAAFNKNRAFQADIEIRTTDKPTAMGTLSGTDTGKFAMSRIGDKLLFRRQVESTLKVSGTQSNAPRKQGQLLVCDGQNLYELQVMGRMGAVAYKRNLDESSPSDLNYYLPLIREHQMLRLLPDAAVNGVPAIVIEGTPKVKGPVTVAHNLYYFHKERGVLLKEVALGPAGEEYQVTEYINLIFDKPLAPQAFMWETPPGVELKDMTADATAQPPAAPTP